MKKSLKQRFEKRERLSRAHKEQQLFFERVIESLSRKIHDILIENEPRALDSQAEQGNWELWLPRRPNHWVRDMYDQLL